MDSKTVVILGGEGVGKTTIAKQLNSSTFQEEHQPGAERIFNYHATFDKLACEFEVNDTTGTDLQANVVSELMMRNGHAFVVVYSITSKKSLDEAKEIIDKLHEVKGTNKVPVILVGCKLDLESSRDVATSDAEALATSYDCQFKEISAKDRNSVIDVFNTLLQNIHVNAPVDEKSKRSDKKCCVLL